MFGRSRRNKKKDSKCKSRSRDNAVRRSPAHRRLQIEPLEERQLLAFYAVDYTGSGNNPFADSTDATTHGGAGTSGNPYQMASLRGAISAADTAGGSNTINLPAGTYTLTLSGSGSLDVTGNLTIIGASEAGTIVESGTSADSGLYTVFDVSSSANATIETLTIQNGDTQGTIDGGGINNAGTLTLAGATVTGNAAYIAGGIYNGGTMTMTNDIVSANLSTNTNVEEGGGLYNAGTLSMSTTTFSSNVLGNNPNNINYGGAIFNGGSLNVNFSTFANNSAGLYGQGGALKVDEGNATISNSVFYGNTTGYYAGAIELDTPSTTSSSVLMYNSTVYDNYAGLDGGGLVNGGGPGGSTLTMVNCTVTDNTSEGNSGGGGKAGGGIRNGNETDGLSEAAVMNLTNTIVAGNFAPNSSSGADIYQNTGASQTVSYSLIGNTSGSGISGGTGNVLNPSSTGLGTFNYYGGPTEVVPLLSGSPAINAGSTSLAVNAERCLDHRSARPELCARRRQFGRYRRYEVQSAGRGPAHRVRVPRQYVYKQCAREAENCRRRSWGLRRCLAEQYSRRQ